MLEKLADHRNDFMFVGQLLDSLNLEPIASGSDSLKSFHDGVYLQGSSAIDTNQLSA